MGRPVRTYDGLRKPLSGGGDNRSVTVTFDYQGELRTVVAPSRKAAFADAAARWGWSWDGEPAGQVAQDRLGRRNDETKLFHGQDFLTDPATARKRDAFRRTGQPYA
jgi:hypothetical protein